MRWKSGLFYLLGGACYGVAMLAAAGDVRAAEWTFGTSADLTGTYDDNIRLSDTDKQSDFGVIFNPQLDVHGHNPTWQVNFSAGLSVARFSKDSTLNSEDPKLLLDSSYRTQLSEFKLTAEASRTSTRVTEETDSGNFATTTERNLLRILPSWTYSVSPRDRLRIGAGWTEADYKSDKFADYRTLTASGAWLRDITTTDILSVTFVVDHSQSDSTIKLDSNVYGALVGWDHNVSERLKTRLEAGPQYYTTEVPVTVNGSPQTENKSKVGFRITAGVDYAPSNVTTFGASVTRRIEPSSGGAPLERSSLEANVRHRFQPRLSGVLRTYFQFDSNPVAEPRSGTERNFASIEPQLIYELGMEWDLAAAYRFRTQESPSADRAYSNAIFATLTYRPLRR